MSRTLLAVSFLCVALISGCGPTPDSLMQESINMMNEFATAVESGATPEKIKEFEARGKDLEKRMNALKLTDADKKALEAKYRPEMEKAATRLMTAMFKGALKGAGGAGNPFGGGGENPFGGLPMPAPVGK